MSTTSYKNVPTLADLERLSVPMDICDYMMIHVTLGDKIKKTGDPSPKQDGKLHASYEIRLSVLPFDRLSDALPGRDEMDVEAYNELHLQQQVTLIFTFDKFRALKTELAAQGVGCIKGRADKEKVHVVDSLFPRTYTKSSLGISLTDAELDERTILLNSWLGELVGEFSSLSFPVQKLVQQFLGLEEDEEERDAPNSKCTTTQDTFHSAILKILKRTYTPPRRVQSTLTSPLKPAAVAKLSKSSIIGALTAVGSMKRKPLDVPAVNETEDRKDLRVGEVVEPVPISQGCVCVVM